ncbi:MAG: hypothetical protein IJ745_04105 [Bacteroidales bacterium]|nr:hypothetical protein [Bacteroidales bacterium]
MRHNEDFDALWQQAEAEGFAQMLSREYPAWQRRSRQRHRTAVAVVAIGLMTGVALPLLTRTPSYLQYDQVCCNRNTLSDGQWADIAISMLTETT